MMRYTYPTYHTTRSGWPWIVTSPITAQVMPNGQPWPRITVVTPSYNQGQFIEETIRSVLLQGYPNLEYIVIDGGSTDGSVEIIEKYEPWLAYWVSEEDRGQSHALNKGFARSTGEIMAWLCSDDLYAPGVLFNVAQALMGKKRTILVGAAIITDGPDTLDGSIDNRHPSYNEMLYDGRTFPQPSVFWTRDLWLQVGPLDAALYYAMDYDYWLRIIPYTLECVFVSDVLSYERTHGKQKTVEAQASSDQVARFAKYKAFLMMRSAQALGEPAIVWLVKSWFRRATKALEHGKLCWLKGSSFQKAALGLIFTRKGRTDRSWL